MNDAHLPYLAVQPQVNTLQLIPIDNPALPHRRVPFRCPSFSPPRLFPPNPTQEAHQYSPILSVRFWLESRIRAVRLTDKVC